LTTITLKKTPYSKVIDLLRRNGIESRPLWKPMHMQPLFRDKVSILNGVSEELFSKGLCLASSTTLTRDDVEGICDIMKEVL
jgi:UDP-N-acetylbacillosamine transaminase